MKIIVLLCYVVWYGRRSPLFRDEYCIHLQGKNIASEKESILTDLINALPGNSSVNTAQHAKIEEAVFSVSEVTSQNSG
jgi:hypothetical protein